MTDMVQCPVCAGLREVFNGKRAVRCDACHGFGDVHESFRSGYFTGRSNGIREVAAFAGSFDKQINHPHRFEDVLLTKFNLRFGRLRKKVQK